MSAQTKTASIACVLVLSAFSAKSSAGVLASLPERHELARVVNLHGGELPTQAAGPLAVQLSAYGKTFILDLVPADIIAPGARTFSVGDKGEVEVPTINYSFEGKIYGNSDSSARLTIVGESMKGLVAIGADLFFIEPKAGYRLTSNPGDIVVTRSGENPLPKLDCGSEEIVTGVRIPFTDSRFAPSLHPPLLRLDEASRHQYRLDVGLLGDSSFVNDKHGGSEALARADMDGALNMASLVFKSVPVSLKIGGRRTYTSRLEELADNLAPCTRNCLDVESFGTGYRCATTTECLGGVERQSASSHLKNSSNAPVVHSMV